MTRAEVVAEARRWLGTPFLHQAQLLGVGVDCGQLLVAVARAVGYAAVQVDGYAKQPPTAVLTDLLTEHLDTIPLAEVAPGDVVLLRLGREANHLAIVTEHGILHAYAPGGVGRVVEHSLDERWRRRIVAAWRFRGIA